MTAFCWGATDELVEGLAVGVDAGEKVVAGAPLPVAMAGEEVA